MWSGDKGPGFESLTKGRNFKMKFAEPDVGLRGEDELSDGLGGHPLDRKPGILALLLVNAASSGSKTRIKLGGATT